MTIPFHLALPVNDLTAARHFYGVVLGCPQGRESERWIDFDFWGHQLVVHLTDWQPPVDTNPVDGEQVPAMHFGPVLPWDQFDTLVERLEAHQIAYLIPPTVRFAGRPGEQRTLFIRDPSGNGLEFKSFRDLSMLFAKDLID